MVDASQLSAVFSEGREGLYLNIHAQPGARKPAMRGLHGDAIKIAIGEAAQEGRANRAIVRFIADSLALRAAEVELTSGETSRRKRVLLHGDIAELKLKVERWLNG